MSFDFLPQQYDPGRIDTDYSWLSIPPTIWRSPWWPLLALILPLGVVDFGIAALMDYIPQSSPYSVIVYGCLGLMAAQALLLSAGLVFGGEAFHWRLLVHWVCLLGLVLIWRIGLFLSDPTFNMRNEHLLRLYCSLPAVSLAIQLPLWIARTIFGWRFVPRDLVTNSKSDQRQANSQLSVRDLFLATAVVAVTLGIGRWAPQPEHAGAMQINYWVVLGLVGAVAAGICLVSVLPMLWFFSRRVSLVVCLALTAGYVVLVLLLSTVVTTSLGVRFRSTELIGLLTIIGCLGAGLAAGLTLLRWTGIDVQRGSPPQTSGGADVPARDPIATDQLPAAGAATASPHK